jgi:hypothetical protein
LPERQPRSASFESTLARLAAIGQEGDDHDASPRIRSLKTIPQTLAGRSVTYVARLLRVQSAVHTEKLYESKQQKKFGGTRSGRTEEELKREETQTALLPALRWKVGALEALHIGEGGI